MKKKAEVLPFQSRFRENQPLVPILAAFLSGVLLDRAFFASDAPSASVGCGVVVWLSLMIGGVFCFRFSPRPLVSLFVAIGAFGGLYHTLYWNFYARDEIAFCVGDDTTLGFVEAKIIRPPEFDKETAFLYGSQEEQITTHFLARVCRRKSGEDWRRASGIIAIRIQGEASHLHTGDLIHVSGKLTRPPEAMNPGDFSPQTHYRKQRILAFLRAPSPQNAEVVVRPTVWGIFRVVEFLRTQAQSLIRKHVAPDAQPLALALFLGNRREVSSFDLNLYLETGVIHLMAVSGLHVGLLAGGVSFMLHLCRMPRRASLITLLCIIFLYVLITGARPPAIRAGIIASVTLLAYYRNYPASKLNTLAAAALFILILNPTEIFSTGTQLSFLAVGTLLFTPILRVQNESQAKVESSQEAEESLRPIPWERLLFSKKRRWETIHLIFFRGINIIGAMLYSSFIMTIVLLPLVVSRFHVAAAVGLALNILLWPPLMLAMSAGFLLLSLSWLPLVGGTLGLILGSTCSYALWLIDALIRFGAEIPGHCFWFQGTPDWWNIVLYLVLIVLAVFPQVRLKKRRHYALLFGGMLLLLCVALYERQPERGQMRCSFISIGHGLAVVIEAPNGKTFLFDAGQFAPPEYPARTISNFLWNAGIYRLDGIFVSHPDMDHYNGISGILERFDTDAIFVSQMTLNSMSDAHDNVKIDKNSDKKALAEVYDAIHRAAIPIRTLERGDVLVVSDDCTIEVLHPSAESIAAAPEMTNANSLVLLIRMGTQRILLTGDLAPPGLEHVLRQYPEKCTIVQAPHHGGRNCCTPQFARWCRPTYFVICESYNNEQAQTTQLFREMGANVFHTGRDGAVIFEFCGENMEILTRKEWSRQW
ncbi:MAG: DNA internalization-related competence protein ComEC/Rec2 [Planctomycetia bacterium]|nr:DNA internalization-related competence protein ComEC/Rec2 [Planctomycetia bacterium]